MGRTKTEKFSNEKNAFAVLNQCLANPARLLLLEHLMSRRRSSAGQLIEAVDLDEVTVRKHLDQLVRIGFAEVHIGEGTAMYSLNFRMFEKWYRKVQFYYMLFIDLRAGQPRKPFDLKKAEEELLLDELKRFIP